MTRDVARSTRRCPRRAVAAAAAALIGAGAAVAVAFDAAGRGSAAPAGTAAAFRATLARVQRQHPDFPGVAALVDAPRVHWRAATGFADPVARTPLTPRTPFRVASITKTFTAAAILRLVERHRLTLTSPIGRHLSPASVAALRGDGYDTRAITIRMLLQHTAGIADFASDPVYPAAVAGAPRHRWTRAEQLRFAVTHGDPLAAPGTAFHYSDTGYILLGEILERTTHMPTPAAYRALLAFDRLGLRHTYMETLEPARGTGSTRAHQYLGDADSFGFDPSFDLHGGGGLVSTLDDIATFSRALFDGRVFTKPSTLAAMRGATAPTGVDQLGLGLFAMTLGGETCFGHQGFWGALVAHCPRSRITIATTVNQGADSVDPSLRLLVELHRQAQLAVHGRRDPRPAPRADHRPVSGDR